MIAAEPVASRRFSRVNRRGHSGPCASACSGCPGIAASSSSCFRTGSGCWSPQWAQSGDENHDLRPAQVKVALLPRSAVGPRASPRTAGTQAKKSTYDAARVAGPGRIRFCQQRNPKERMHLRYCRCLVSMRRHISPRHFSLSAFANTRGSSPED
jgi:hypothetical protein